MAWQNLWAPSRKKVRFVSLLAMATCHHLGAHCPDILPAAALDSDLTKTMTEIDEIHEALVDMERLTDELDQYTKRLGA
jgi:hypothetical protein